MPAGVRRAHVGRVLRKDLPRVRLRNGVSVRGVPRHFAKRKTLGSLPGQRRDQLSRISSAVCYVFTTIFICVCFRSVFLCLLSPRAFSHSPWPHYSQGCNSDRDCAEYEWCASNFNNLRCGRNLESFKRHVQLGHEYGRYNPLKYWNLNYLACFSKSSLDGSM